MSYVVDTGDENKKYRGGYATSKIFNSEEIREATSTLENYVNGTVILVFLIFFVFILLTAFTFIVMCCIRYVKQKQPKGGFYNPPPMVTRYASKSGKTGTYSTLTRSEYSSLPRQAQAPSAMSGATSQQTDIL